MKQLLGRSLKALSRCSHAYDDDELVKDLKSVINNWTDRATNDEIIVILEKLACLGNGDCYGNSVGNKIAIEAIEKINWGSAMTKSDLSKTYRILAGDMETTAILTREHSGEREQTIRDALDFFADRLRDRADAIDGGGE